MSTLIVIPSYLPVILIKCRNYRYQNHSPLIFYIILNMLLNTQKLLHVYTSNFTFKKLIADINSITFPRIFLLFEPNLFQTNPKVRLVRLRCGSKKIFGGGGVDCFLGASFPRQICARISYIPFHTSQISVYNNYYRYLFINFLQYVLLLKLFTCRNTHWVSCCRF